MKFVFNEAYARGVKGFGKYRQTFISDEGEVEAQLFEQNDGLIAYVSLKPGVTFESLHDPYVGPLNRYAAELGFAGKLHLRYS